MFKYTICEPLNPKIVDKGSVTEAEFRTVLQNFPWNDMLKEMNAADESDVCFSPSLELVDTKSTHSLAISIVGEESDSEFYIFYKRPKTVTRKKWFKTVETFDPEYLSDRTGQTINDVEEAFNALLSGNLELLEARWG